MQHTVRKIKNLGPLHDLFLEACPPDDKGNKSVPLLAKALSVTQQSLYKCIEMGRIPTAHGLPSRLVDISEGRVSRDDIMPFVMGI